MQRHRMAVAAILLAAALGLTACGGAPKARQTGTATTQDSGGGPRRGGTVVVAVPADPGSLFYDTAAGAMEEIAANIYEGLLSVDSKGNLQPGLATRWEISDDGTQFTFHLRPDVYFHNGRKLEATDVKYSLERIVDPSVTPPHPRLGDYKDLDHVDVVDPATVRVVLKRPNGALLSNLATTFAGIIPRDVPVEQLKTRPVGTGPFQFVEWVPNDHITLKRFDRYWQKDLPYLDGVTFRIMPDASQQLLALQQGQVDIIPRLAPEQADAVRADPKLQLLSGPQNLVQLLAMNNKARPFDDVRVRQAISYAINRQAIIDGAAAGLGTPIGTHMTPSLASYYVDLTGLYPYDPEKARRLLADAGYAGGFDVTISLPEPYPIHRRAGEIIAEQLGRVGIRAKLDVLEWNRWLKEVYTGRQYQLTVIGHTGRLDPDAVLDRYNSQAASNYMNFSDPRVDQLLADGAATVDQQRRRQIYAEIEKLLAQEAASYYIMDPSQVVAMRRELQGYEIYPIYIDYFLRVWRGA